MVGVLGTWGAVMRTMPLILTAALTMSLCGSAAAEAPKPVPAEQFDKTHKLIKRQDGEWLWAEVPWSIQFADAQRRALAEGKPIFAVMSAQGSAVGCL